MSDANLSDSDTASSGSPTVKSTKRDVNLVDSAQVTQPTFFPQPKAHNQLRMQQSPPTNIDSSNDRNALSRLFNNSKRMQTDEKVNRTLALMHKGLCKLPPIIFEKISSLKILDLSHNNFEYFPIEVTQVSTLQILRLNFNRIKKVPAEVSKLTGLEILSLSHNHLQKLPSTLPQLSALKGLHLESNFIESFGEEVTGIKSLECLNIYHNRLHCLPTSLKNLKKLRELRFEWLRYLGSASCYWREEDDATGLFKLRKSCEEFWNNGRNSINFLEFLNLFPKGKGEEFDLMHRDKYGCTILHQACLCEDLGVVRNLISAAPELIDLADFQNRTPLCYSLLKDRHRSSNYLLKHGANPTKQCGSEGSPIHIAVKKLNIDVVRGILRLGEKVNKIDSDGNTPLHYAMALINEDYQKATQIIEELLDNGADPNIKNNEGWTPMLSAVRKRDKKAIDWALSYNFGTLEICGRNEVFDMDLGGGPHNWTTMHIAAYSENLELIETLGEAGANMFAKSLNGYTPKKVVGKPGIALKLVTKYERDFIKKKIIEQQTQQYFVTPRERIPTQIVANLHGGKKPVSNVSRNLFANNSENGADTCTNTAPNEHHDFSISSHLTKNFMTPFNHSRQPSHVSTPFGADTRINMHVTMTETKHLFIRRDSEDSSEILPESEVGTLSHSLEELDISHPDFCGSDFNENGKVGSSSQVEAANNRKVLPTKNIKNKLSETLARMTLRLDQANNNNSQTFSQGTLKDAPQSLTMPSEAFNPQKYEAYLKHGMKSGFEFWERQAKHLEEGILKEDILFFERLRILSAFKIYQKIVADHVKKNPELLTSKKTSIFSLPEKSYSLLGENLVFKSKTSNEERYLDLTMKSLVKIFATLKNDVPANVSLKMFICRFIGDSNLPKAVDFLKSVAMNNLEPYVVKMEANRMHKLLIMNLKPEMGSQPVIRGFRPEMLREKNETAQERHLIFGVEKPIMASYPVKKSGLVGVVNFG